ncbi:uncharacterized protein TRAVEDRAFT_147114 [Trametes versicolor FP-101664 SS1]|uniref:uncharacterized protein n=1 Tax=Trametes versicolor (strain FP-101664) TaxID=717944 RepID=UPI0004623609|nr:uncharacterized protein TRAVEDRAFT_147114 [Trametes versicolor FP-101664 SS1]EIW59210.1 hypothetical protein TRAVEDRAFT_147114 [Trametes versicolor FP-101664 SS1]
MSNSTGNSTDSDSVPDLSQILPPYLNLPPHLSAHKYFFVCTLTVAAWDTLVLSPRTWRLLRTREWPPLKILFHFLRVFMPLEFTVVGVAFFDTKWSQAQCSHFFLFEPICTAILLAACSLVHVIRVNAIYEKSRNVLFGMGGLLAFQVVVTAICCGFFRSTPLLEGQGCIAEPKSNWVGIYWLSATLTYTASFALAVQRSLRSLDIKPLSYWKLMLRDGLNLYGAIWAVNMVNMLFWFIIKPTGPEDPVRTIVTSMAAVLTASMTMRIILSVRGSLVSGGSFAVSSGSAPSRSGNTTHVLSSARAGAGTAPSANPVLSLARPGADQPATYAVPLGAADKGGADWDGKSSVGGRDQKEGDIFPTEVDSPIAVDVVPGVNRPSTGGDGVRVTVESETDFTYVKEKN